MNCLVCNLYSSDVKPRETPMFGTRNLCYDCIKKWNYLCKAAPYGCNLSSKMPFELTRGELELENKFREMENVLKTGRNPLTPSTKNTEVRNPKYVVVRGVKNGTGEDVKRLLSHWATVEKVSPYRDDWYCKIQQWRDDKESNDVINRIQNSHLWVPYEKTYVSIAIGEYPSVNVVQGQ